MNKEKYIKIIVDNLKKQLELNDKTQQDIANDLGFSKSTVNSWFTGYRVPRIDKIDLLCDYFGCTRSDILDTPEDNNTHINTYILEIANKIYSDEKLRKLFQDIIELDTKEFEDIINYINYIKTKR